MGWEISYIVYILIVPWGWNILCQSWKRIAVCRIVPSYVNPKSNPNSGRSFAKPQCNAHFVVFVWGCLKVMVFTLFCSWANLRVCVEISWTIHTICNIKNDIIYEIIPNIVYNTIHIFTISFLYIILYIIISNIMMLFVFTIIFTVIYIYIYLYLLYQVEILYNIQSNIAR